MGQPRMENPEIQTTSCTYDVACISGFSIFGLCSVYCSRRFLYLWSLHSWFVFCAFCTMLPVSLGRIQRYRKHRAQSTEHKPRMVNPEIQATSCTIHRTRTKNEESRDTGNIVHNCTMVPVSLNSTFLVCVLCIVHDVACISRFSILGLCSIYCARCCLYLWILHSWFVFCVLCTMFPVYAQNTNQEWRIQRYRQHRAQYIEHKPRMENPEIQATSCTIHRTQTMNGESRDTGNIVHKWCLYL
jgi:hypothetical protein